MERAVYTATTSGRVLRKSIEEAQRLLEPDPSVRER
jgi:hypothetical protein